VSGAVVGNAVIVNLVGGGLYNRGTWWVLLFCVEAGSADVGIDEVGRGNQPLNLRGWGHHSHIPTKGEEIHSGLFLCRESPCNLCKPSPDLSTRWCGASSSLKMFDECLGPMKGVAVSSTYQMYCLLL